MSEFRLQVKELQELVRIVSELYQFAIGARDRYALISTAGLTRFLPGLDLDGLPRTVASNLVQKLADYGDLPDRPTYHALGALLSYVLTLGELPRDDASFLAGVIVGYSLVADPVYVDRLRAQFGIGGAVTREPDAGQAVSPAAAHMPPSRMYGALDEQGPVAAMIRELGMEAVLPSQDSFVDVHSLLGAMYSARAVCRVELPRTGGMGTGFLVGPDLMLTSHSMLSNLEAVKGAVVRFDYVVDAAGVAQPGRVFKLRPDFYHFSPMSELDYALVRLEDEPLKHVAHEPDLSGLSVADLARLGKHRGYLELAPRLIRKHERVNIIQHPGGEPLKVVMTQNYVVEDMGPSKVHYVANTRAGSAGAPVFDQNWQVVALHHAGRRYSLDSWKGAEVCKGTDIKVNEGICMRAILEDLRKSGMDQHLPM